MTNASRIVFALLLLALILASADLLVATLGVVFLIFAGLLFGIFVHAISAWPTAKFRLSYRTSYLVVVSLMLLLIVLGAFYLGAQVFHQADEFWTQLQSASKQINKRLDQYPWAEEYLPSVSEIQTQLTQSGSDIVPAMFYRLQSFAWAITAGLVIFFVGLYSAYDPELYRVGLIELFPEGRREHVRQVLNRLRSTLQRWIVGRMFSMAVVGIATAIGLSVFGVPLPITLGVIAALLTFIPNIGPLLAAIPQMLLAIELGAEMMLYVLLFNVVLQTVESYLLTPIIQKQEVSLPPVLTISAQLLMGVTVGIVGVMMAAPFVVVLMVLVNSGFNSERSNKADLGDC